MPRIVHFEISVEDPETVARFYTDVFGWRVERWDGGEEPYWMVTTGEEEPGTNGGIMRRRDGFPSVVNTLGVASLEESIGQVEGAGGSVVVPPTAIPDMGRVAYCADPGGTVFGLFESAASG